MSGLSRFGERFAGDTGARLLMEDLGEAISGERPMLMLGGGNPARIPEVEDALRERLATIAASRDTFAATLGNYDPPSGNAAFITALAELLHEACGWPVTERNIVLTAGSQSGFFALFNLLAGEFDDASRRRILLPILPEYIGYADLGLGPDLFRSCLPRIDETAAHRFKYRLDFDTVTGDDDVAGICVSRPTNPTGNVIDDDELARLGAMARRAGVPLIVDSAYGLPFPGIVYTDASTPWQDELVVCMSLSKLGLPGARTGIVVASEAIADAISGVNAVTALSVGGIGPALVREMVADRSILSLSREVIRPFYEQRLNAALAAIDELFEGIDYRVHEPGGAFFLWLWFPDLPVSSETLYARLKERGVLVLSGHYFFPGLDADWPHRSQCLRVSYAQPPEVVRAGLAVIADEVRGLGG